MAKKIKNIKFILPSNNDRLQKFIDEKKTEMTEQVVSCIELAVKQNLPFVEVFQFEDSTYVITLPEKDFLPNLENIYNYYVSSEQYELCKRVTKLKSKLNKGILI